MKDEHLLEAGIKLMKSRSLITKKCYDPEATVLRLTKVGAIKVVLIPSIKSSTI